jgi:uncharacterized protein
MMRMAASLLLALMAVACAHDKVTDRRPPQPAERFVRAATAGDPIAQFNLGVTYANGEGGSEDFVQAAANYRRSAEQGHAAAAAALAFLYYSGQGVPKDSAEALKWIQIAESRAEPDQRWVYRLWREYVSSTTSHK